MKSLKMLKMLKDELIVYTFLLMKSTHPNIILNR
jgi:hypothetical protein